MGGKWSSSNRSDGGTIVPRLSKEIKMNELQKFWEKSGWRSDENPTPQLGLSEGRLCIDTWNAAINAALKCVHVDGNPLVAQEKIVNLFFDEK